MIDAGLSPQEAVHALRTALSFLVGTLMREVEAAPTFSATHPASRARRDELEHSGLDPVAAVAPYLAICDHEAEFEYGLQLLLNAFEARISALPPKPSLPE
jgi:hypothetical protein